MGLLTDEQKMRIIGSLSLMDDILTERDALGDGNALYEIERTIKGSGIPFDDGSHIIYVSADLADYDTELGKLMHDLRCTDPKEMEYDVLMERVRYFKGKTEGRIEMASEFDKVLGEILKEIEDKRAKENLERGLKEGTEKGLKAGRMEEARRVARSMIADGSIPLPKVAEFSGLTLSEVESISSSFKA